MNYRVFLMYAYNKACRRRWPAVVSEHITYDINIGIQSCGTGSGRERNEFIYVRERVKKNKGRDVKQCARIASHSIYYYVIYSHVAYIIPRVDNINIYICTRAVAQDTI